MKVIEIMYQGNDYRLEIKEGENSEMYIWSDEKNRWVHRGSYVEYQAMDGINKMRSSGGVEHKPRETGKSRDSVHMGM